MYGVPNAYGVAYGGPAAYLHQEFADSMGLHESKRNGSTFSQQQSRVGYSRHDGRDGGAYASSGQAPQRQAQPQSYAPPLRLPLPSPNDERMSIQGNSGPPPPRQMSSNWQRAPEYGYQETGGYRGGERAAQYYGQVEAENCGMEQTPSSYGGMGAGQRDRAHQMGRYQQGMEDPRYRDHRAMEESWHSYGMPPPQDRGRDEWQGRAERHDYGERMDRREYGEMRDPRAYQEQREQRVMENMGYDPHKKSGPYAYNMTTVADPGSGSGVVAGGGGGGVALGNSPKIVKGDASSVRSGSGPSLHSDRSGSDGETESVKAAGAEEGAGKGLDSMSTELPGWSRRSQLVEAISSSTGRDLGTVQEALEACSWDRERAAVLLLRNDSNTSNLAYQEYGMQLNAAAGGVEDLDPQGFVAATPTTGPTPVGTPRLQPAQSPGGTVHDRERQDDSLFKFDYTLPHPAASNSMCMYVDPFSRPGMWGSEGPSYQRQDSEDSKESEGMPSRRGSAAVVRTLTPGPDSSAVALSTGRALSWSDILSADASGRGARPTVALEQLEKSYVEAARAHPTQELNRRYMTTFRIRLCPVSNCKDTPNRRCFNAHNPKHARRLPAAFKVPGSGIQYVYYPKRCLSMWLHGVCEEGVRCQYAHSTDEILYHPLVFRTQRCDFWGEPLPCPRMGPHCPKAHNPNELRSAADVPPELFVDPASLGKAAELKFRHTFDVRTYKTMPCLKQKSKTREPKARAATKAKKCTDRVSCDGYHDAKERRRHPDYFNYSSEPCPAVYDRDLATWGYPSACEKGDHCPLAHSLMEVMYHRDKYKTKPCERWGKPPLQCSWGERCAYKHGEQDNGYTPPKLPLRPANAVGSAQQMPHPSAPGTDMALAYALGVHQQNQQLMEYTGQASQMRANSDTQSVATSASGRDTPTDLQKRLDDAEQQVAQLMTEHEWLEQSLECPVCRELGSRDRALPCGHVVCHTCLGVQANAQPREYEMFAPTLACPVCQKVHPINSVYKIIL